MTGETPGAVPTDEFLLLGPAVAPRRSAGEPPVDDADELPAPFVGGRPDVRGERSREHSGADEDRMTDDVAAEADDWSLDDLPWLVPEAPAAQGGAAVDDPWQPSAGDRAGVGGEGPYQVDEELDADSVGWLHAPGAGGAATDAAEPAPWEAWEEAAAGGAEEPFGAGPAGEEPVDVSALAPDELDAGADGLVGEVEWGGGGRSSAAAATGESVPVDAPALPVEEWTEAGPSVDGEAVAGEAAPGGAGRVDPALVEVAERLERIALSLRSGRPVEAVEDGDPLQLLITGYALGYAQARRGRAVD